MKYMHRLALPLAFTLVMLVLRVCYSFSLHFCFLTWNLFLAFMPLVFSHYTLAYKHKRASWLFAALWLLFFPNGAYVITDLVHMGEQDNIPMWYDALLLFSAAMNGLVMALLSLRQIEKWLLLRMKPVAVKLVIMFILFLSGFGIYLGRVQRWNSWDIVCNPFALVTDIVHHIIHPFYYAESWLLSVVFAVWMMVVYGMTGRRPKAV